MLRLVPILLLAGHPLEGDASAYHDTAVRLLSGRPFELWWPPGLPLYLAAFVGAFGDSSTVAMAAMLPWYLAASLLLARVAGVLGGRPAALAATALFAVYPSFVFHSSYPLTAMPVATLLLAIVLVLLRSSKEDAHPVRRSVFLGALVGVVSLFRASSLALLALLPVPAWRSPRRAAATAAGLVTAGVIVFAWIADAHRITGNWVPINYANTRNFFLGNNPWTPLYKTWLFGSHDRGPDVPDEFRRADRAILDLPVEKRDRLYRRAAFDHILRRPDLFLLRTFSRIRCYFAFDTYTGTILIKYFGAPKAIGLACIAADAAFYLSVLFGSILFFLLPSARTGRRWPILAVVFGYALPYWIAFSHPTYHLPVAPLGIACASAFAARIRAREIAWRSDLLPIVRSPQGAALLFLAAGIQVEWVIVMFGRAAAIS